MRDAVANIADEIQVVLFKVADKTFCLEITQVREVIRIPHITPVPDTPSFVLGVLNLRGEIMPVVDLSVIFAASKTDLTARNARVVIAESETTMAGFCVDRVFDVSSISVDRITPTPDVLGASLQRKYMKGVARLNGDVALLLDVDKLLQPEEMDILKQLAEEQTPIQLAEKTGDNAEEDLLIEEDGFDMLASDQEAESEGNGA